MAHMRHARLLMAALALVAGMSVLLGDFGQASAASPNGKHMSSGMKVAPAGPFIPSQVKGAVKNHEFIRPPVWNVTCQGGCASKRSSCQAACPADSSLCPQRCERSYRYCMGKCDLKKYPR